MKDFLGNDLEIGDEIVWMTLKYRSLRKGIITKITNKTILIDGGYKQFPNQVIKIKK